MNDTHMAHSPGPWFHGKTSDDILTAKGFHPVASPPENYDEDQWAADAPLIAAAPDLLAALHLARRALQANEEITSTWELYQHSPEMKAINAAIEKAEGRADG